MWATGGLVAARLAKVARYGTFSTCVNTLLCAHTAYTVHGGGHATHPSLIDCVLVCLLHFFSLFHFFALFTRTLVLRLGRLIIPRLLQA